MTTLSPWTVEVCATPLLLCKRPRGDYAPTLLKELMPTIEGDVPEGDHVHIVPLGSTDQVSDGFHTFAELYEFRMLYNAHAVVEWLSAGVTVTKSWRHDDGKECFGGGWFIVTADLPSGQVTNHYRAEHWDLFYCPAVDLAPAWDGHTAADVAQRLRTYIEMQ